MSGNGGPALTTVGRGQGHAAHEYRHGLDGLRALAVVAVLAFHLDRLPGGNLGVDSFFVLSGWLITWRMLAEADRSSGRDGSASIDLGRFWGARVRRLMPASLMVIVFVAVVWSLLDIDVPSLRRDLVFALGWSSNWGTITGGGDYWARFGEPSPVTHFWSLAIEEQFYIVWPLLVALLVWFGGRRRRLAVGVVAAVAAVGSIVMMVTQFDAAAPTATYMNTFARMHSLLIGAVAACITVGRGDRLRGGAVARRLAPFAAVTVLTLIAVSSHRSTWLFRWGFPVFAVAMAVVVVAVADGRWAGPRTLASAPLRWIGDRSYGLYLWHWPVFLLLSPQRARLDGVVLDVARVAVSVAFSAASFRWLETPLRRRQWITGWRAPGFVAGALGATIAVVAITLPATTGGAAAPTVVTLAPVDVAAAPAVAAPAPATTTSTIVPAHVGDARSFDGSRSAFVASAAPTATSAPATAPLRVLVAGDSTALHLADALLPYASAHPDQLVAGNAAFPGCGLSAADDGRMHEFSNEDGKLELIDLSGCTTQWQSIVERVGSAEQIDVVLVDIGAWDGVDIHLADGRVVSVADPVGRQTVQSAYEKFVTAVTAEGATVAWVTPADLHLQWGRIDAPVNDPDRWVAMRSIIDSLPVTQIDLPGWLAANGLDGPDGVHLATDVNERFVTDVVVPQLLALPR